MAIKTLAEVKKLFNGVSSVRFAKTVQATLAAAAWDFELPIANDSLNITQAAGTLNPTKVFGLAGAWTITGQPGNITIDMFLPTIHDDLMGIFYTKNSTSLSTADETVGNVTGTFAGYGYFLTNEMLEGSAMIISENRQYALFLKHVQGYPSLVFDSPLDKPMGVNLSLQIVGGNSEADIALLTWTPKTP